MVNGRIEDLSSRSGGQPPFEQTPSPARVEAFSDGVFAIIITLLVLDIRVPREATLHGEPLVEALLRQWPVYVAYALSFLQVGVVWANHHTMFHHIRRSDHVLLVYNLLLLMCVALLPFTSALLAEYARGSDDDLRLSALVYSAALGGAGFFFSAIWHHAQRAGLVDHRSNPHRLHALGWHWRFFPVFYGVAFAFAFVDPRFSVAMYMLLLIYYALPGPAVVRWMRRRRERRTARA